MKEPRSRVRVKARVWVECQGKPFLGKGRVSLLKAIDTHGSISAGARSIGLSYRAAWNWVDEMNRRSPKPLILKSTGGRGGGGAALTKTGKIAIQTFRHLNQRVEKLCLQAGVLFLDLFFNDEL
jgi:molybdate transport system regulatory protein